MFQPRLTLLGMFMHKSVYVRVVLIGLLPLTGCGGSGTPLPAASHSGALFPLPDSRGFFEIKTEAGTRTGRGARSKVASAPFHVYFYKADGSSPIDPAPTDVSIKIGSAEKNTTITLTPDKSASSTAGTAFASPPGHYPEAFRGELTATIDGQSVTASFMFR